MEVSALKKEKKIQKSFIYRFEEFSGCPVECISNRPVLWMHGAERLCIENYKKLLMFEQDRVEILTSIGKIVVLGKNLKFLFFSKEYVVIQGMVTQISMENDFS